MKHFYIAILMNGCESYGELRGMLTMAKGLRASGCSVISIAVSDGRAVDAMKREDFCAYVLGLKPHQALSQNIFVRLRQLFAMREHGRQLASLLQTELQNHHVDILYFRSPLFVAAAGLAAKRAGVSSYWHMPNIVGKGLPFGLNRRIYQWLCYRRAVQPLANSQYTANTLGANPVKPEVLHVGTDTSRFDPDHVQAVSRDALGIPSDAVVLLIAARLTSAKGQHRILQAMSRCSHHESMHLVLLGGPLESDFADQLRKEADAIGVSDRLHMLGSVDNVSDYYPMADIAINAYIFAEAYGQSVIEAMLMQKPVLVHALGGPAETVVDGETGWHVKDPRVESFQAGLERALSDRHRWAEMGEQAQKRALEKYSAQTMVERFMKIAGIQ